MERRLVKLSKFLSYILRHHPEDIGLELDNAGWVSVEELITAARQHGRNFSRDDLLSLMDQSPKKRFTLSRDGEYIRANYGHSIDIDPGYEPKQPPEVLYHGTARRFLASIHDRGITTQNRQFVHLSQDEVSAGDVGKRHGKPVILRITSGKMYRDGFTFYQSDEGLWLTKRIPVSYIIFPEERRG